MLVRLRVDVGVGGEGVWDGVVVRSEGVAVGGEGEEVMVDVGVEVKVTVRGIDEVVVGRADWVYVKDFPHKSNTVGTGAVVLGIQLYSPETCLLEATTHRSP